MNKSQAVLSGCKTAIWRSFSRPYSARNLKKNWAELRKTTRNTELALDHFDGLYGKVYGRAWPSMRLGLLSPKKPCAVLNSFVDNEEIRTKMIEEDGAIDIQRYYKKHLHSYTRWQLRQQILENKRARKRELMAKSQDVPLEMIDPDSVDVSDVSDSELRGGRTTDASDWSGFSTAEDLHEMFTDRRMDDDEKYFINKASTQLSLTDYVPATELIIDEALGDEITYYNDFTDDVQLDLDFKEEGPLMMDDQLKILTFPRTDLSLFENPKPITHAKLLPYYLLDGASILAVLTLGIQFGDSCADYCAAPGGKSLAMLMSMKPEYLLCNDSSTSRLNRLHKIIKQYVPDIKYRDSTLNLVSKDARHLVAPETFDKILVDVPCSNDRHSIETLDNNIFKRARSQERLSLPTTQCDILKSALKSLKPKGALVYSTCTLSPIENDGVVQRALLQLQEQGFPQKFAIMNLKETFRPLRGLFKFNTKSKFGQQVLPYICSNFGPMYICKIKRLS